ncbi:MULTISPECIES: hypothetical protein [Pseudomonas]|nr:MULTISPECIES: hypothetical protein [Pseudomonas]
MGRILSAGAQPVSPTLMWEGIPLFDVSDAIRLIEYCEGNDIAVLGIEGFRIAGDKRVPDMDCIVGFSASINEDGFVGKSLEVSKRIIKEVDDLETLLEFLLVKI